MSLEIKVQKFSNHCKVALVGKCTIYNVTRLKQALLETINNNQNILIDLEKVSDFDTAGMQLFISAKNTVKLSQKKIKFTSHPICVIAILELYGLTSFFGDKIVLTATERQQFSFRYGIKKHSLYGP
jgi:anti-anti-sigma factor